MEDKIYCELSFCLGIKDKEQFLKKVYIKKGSTILDLLEKEDFFNKYSKLDTDFLKENIKLGIFGKLKSLKTIIENNDRIEIYKPLKIDPIDARRIRAEVKRKKENLRLFGA